MLFAALGSSAVGTDSSGARRSLYKPLSRVPDVIFARVLLTKQGWGASLITLHRPSCQFAGCLHCFRKGPSRIFTSLQKPLVKTYALPTFRTAVMREQSPRDLALESQGEF